MGLLSKLSCKYWVTEIQGELNDREATHCQPKLIPAFNNQSMTIIEGSKVIVETVNYSAIA